MAATIYTDQQEYAKFNQKKGCGEHGHPDDCGCKGPKEDGCGCCPVGLVESYDSQGHVAFRSTPNDAELYLDNIFTCKDGYGKLLDADGKFVGCFLPSDLETLYPIYHPS